MYNVSSTYKTKIRQSGREFEFACTIDASEEINLTKDDVLRFERFFNCGADIELGGVYPVGYKLTFANPGGLYSEVNFGGGTIDPSVGIKISGSPEYIAYNTGYIAARPKPTSTIELLAYDGLYKLNVPYVSTLSYPATLLEIAEDIADSVGLSLASTVFPNSNAVVQQKPDFADITKTQVLSWIAQLAGSFVRLNRYEQIEFCWYDTVEGNPITTDHCRKMVIDKPIAPISGVIYGDLIAGTDDNAIEIKDNFLLENITDKATVLSNINTRINGTTYYPYDIEWVGDFAYMPGDRITIVDRDSVSYNTILMQDTLTLTTGLKCVSSAKTKTIEEKNYVSGTGVKTAKLRQQIKELDMKVDEQRTSLEVAIEDSANLMARSMNCYTFSKQAGDGWIAGAYLSFVPEEEADTETEVWVQSASGFVHYPNGVSGVPDIGMSASGTLVAKLVAAGIVTADMVKTGILQNEDGSVYINLNTGEVRFSGKVDIKVGESETLDALAKDVRKIIEPSPFGGFGLSSEFIDLLAREINIYGLVTFHALDNDLKNQVNGFSSTRDLVSALTMLDGSVTKINGGMIATGTILADAIAAKQITIAKIDDDTQTKINNGNSAKSTLDSNASTWTAGANAGTTAKSTLDAKASTWDSAASNASVALQAINDNADYWDLGADAKELLDTLTMVESGVTKINGGMIATNTIAANRLAITDLKDLYASGGLTKTKISGWTMDPGAIVGVYSTFSTVLRVPVNSDTVVFQSGLSTTPSFKVNAMGQLEATQATIKGSVSATSFEVLNSSNQKIGGLYGSGSSAYLGAGRLINPTSPSGINLKVGVPLGDLQEAIQLLNNEEAYLSLISFPSGGSPYTEIRGHGTYLMITNGKNLTYSPYIQLDLLTLVGERRITLDGTIRINGITYADGNLLPTGIRYLGNTTYPWNWIVGNILQVNSEFWFAGKSIYLSGGYLRYTP